MEPEAKYRTLLAPAKINLALHVTGRRADGYHLLDSLAVFTRFGDRLQVEPAERDAFSVSGPFASGVSLDDDNLVVKAREALRREAGAARTPPVAIRLEKNLPIASGVGGGSSDAAAALNGLARLWALDIDEAELARIGLTLGADLPMCLKAKPLIARGIGDELSPLAGFPALALVLVNPGVAVSTPEVFKALSRRDSKALPPLPSRLDFHTIWNWLETTRNDLEPAARSIQPAVDETLKALKRAGAAFARMSGSGATCFGLFETGNVAKRAAIDIRGRHPGWFVAATRSMEAD
ncbi:MAG: 4-(cytidine 5'-diphospho)-2-C-methyl-D-erythritol kinase [Mesorhizobium sp.]|nr:MAG: 4-(cytidine 5'-diphospho)-2-C-methyl-D-erythritol kinase [Mesorhizobium sp.]